MILRSLWNKKPFSRYFLMDPVIRVGTKHEDSDRRMIILCMVSAAPFAALIATLMYWLGATSG